MSTGQKYYHLSLRIIFYYFNCKFWDIAYLMSLRDNNTSFVCGVNDISAEHKQMKLKFVIS